MTKKKADMYIPDEDRREELGKIKFYAKTGQIKVGRRRKYANRPNLVGHARCKCEECGHITLQYVAMWDNQFGQAGVIIPFTEHEQLRGMLKKSTEPPIPEHLIDKIKDTDF